MPDVRALTRTLAWLVDIPSETGHESQIRDAISERLSDHPQQLVETSLVVGDPGPGKVALVGHTDTVPLQGEPGSRLDGDRLFGLGSTDMKGGLAVIIHLIEDLGTEVAVGVFYAGEEGALDDNELGPVLDSIPGMERIKAGIVMEPTNREVHAGCQGSINARVSFVGEPSHSARPWLGVNAITRAGPFLTMMDGLEPEVHEIEGLHFKEVMSVTTAHGGLATNIIPGRFDVNVNYRFSPDRTTEQAVDHLRSLCRSADGFEVSNSAPAAYPETSHPFFQRLIAASGSQVSHKQGWTDVAQLAERGIPAINFGPGEASLAHKPGESIALDDLAWAYDILRQVLA